MRYVLMDVRKNDEIWSEEFDDLDAAIAKGQKDFDSLTRSEKNNVKLFCVIESVNSDETADNHYDGDIVREWK